MIRKLKKKTPPSPFTLNASQNRNPNAIGGGLNLRRTQTTILNCIHGIYRVFVCVLYSICVLFLFLLSNPQTHNPPPLSSHPKLSHPPPQINTHNKTTRATCVQISLSLPFWILLRVRYILRRENRKCGMKILRLYSLVVLVCDLYVTNPTTTQPRQHTKEENHKESIH